MADMIWGLEPADSLKRFYRYPIAPVKQFTSKDALDSVQAIAQNNVIIIDEKMVIAGRSIHSVGGRTPKTC